MSTLAEIREALAEALSEIPETVQVFLLGGDYTEASEKFAIRVLAGEPSAASEARLDELLAFEGEQSLSRLLELDLTLGHVVSQVAVRKHSGHRAYKQPDETVQLGTELQVDVYR